MALALFRNESDQRINFPIRTNTQRFCLLRAVHYQPEGFSSPRNPTRAIPDCAEIVLRSGGETRAAHSGRDRRLSFRKVSKSKGADGPLFSPSIRAARRASSF